MYKHDRSCTFRIMQAVVKTDCCGVGGGGLDDLQSLYTYMLTVLDAMIYAY
jgi:hypothetical protein